MREIRQSGSEGGGTETNRSFLPLSSPFAPPVQMSFLATNGPWSYPRLVTARYRTVSTLVAGAIRPVLRTQTDHPFRRAGVIDRLG
jgi:hypothetical protein